MNHLARAAAVICALAFTISDTVAAPAPEPDEALPRVGFATGTQGFPLRYRLAVGSAGPPGVTPDVLALAASPDGTFYALGVPDGKSYTSPAKWVYRHDANGRLIGSWRSQATDVAVAADGSVWLTESDPIRLAHYAAAGAFLDGTTDTGIFGLDSDGNPCPPRLVTVGPDGWVHVLSDCVGLIRFGPPDQMLYSISPIADPAHVKDMVAGQDGRLYAAVSGTIEVFSRLGGLVDVWPGGEGHTPGTFGKFCVRADPYCLEYDVGPTTIELTPDGLIAASDPGNDRIQRFTVTGVAAGQVPRRVASFAWLTDNTIAHTQSSRLYACEVDGTEIGHAWGSTSPRTFGFLYDLDVSRDENLLVSAPWGLLALSRDGRAVGWFSAVNWGPYDHERWRGFAYDIDGTALIATDQEIARFAVDGTHLGSWPARAGEQPFAPMGICVGPSGSVIAGDETRSMLHSFSPDGEFERSWGATAWGVDAIGSFVLDCGPDGTVLLLDTDHKRVLTLNASSQAPGHWNGSASTIGRLVRPVSIAGAPDGSVLVLDREHPAGRLLHFTSGGEYLSTLLHHTDVAETRQPQRVAIGPSGTVYVPAREGAIQRMTLEGQTLEDLSFPSPGYGSFDAIGAVTRAPGGSVWVGDLWQQRVQRIGQGGELLETWGASERGMPRSLYGDIAATPDGGLWIADPYVDEISLHDHEGALSVVAGGELPEDQQLLHVAGTDVTSSGEIVVADTGNGNIVRFDPDGSVRGMFAIEWSLTEPYEPSMVADLAVALDDTVLVLDHEGQRLWRYSLDGTPLRTWVLPDLVPDRLKSPTVLNVARNGHVYLGDTGDNRVVELDPLGRFVRSWVVPDDWPIVSIAASHDSVYVLSREPSTGDRVIVYDLFGTMTGAWPLGTWHQPPFRATGLQIDADEPGVVRVVEYPSPPVYGPGVTRYRPDGSAVDHVALDLVTGSSGRAMRARYAFGADRVYVAGEGRGTYGRNGVVYGFGTDGSLDSAWRESTESRGHLWCPQGLAVGLDGSGSYEVYVSNTCLGRVEVFAPDGRHKRSLGSEGSGPGQFRQPLRLEASPDGTLLVADSLNHRVQRITPDGDVVDIWTGFNEPTAVAVGPQGEAYVLDGRRIQARSPSGEALGWLDAKGLLQGELQAPADIAVADDGTLWITDSAERRVVAFGTEPLPAWQVSYYRDASWTDGPVYITTTNTIDFDWGLGSPAPFVPDDGYAVRFERVLPMHGPYSWDLTVEGEAAFSPGRRQPATVVSGHPAEARVAAPIEGEPLRVHVDYIDTGENASIRLVPRASPQWTHSVVLPAVCVGMRHS